jgi:hypothetical protein
VSLPQKARRICYVATVTTQGVEQFGFWTTFGPWIQNLIFFVLGIVATAVFEKRRTLRGDYELWVWIHRETLRKPNIGASQNALQYTVNGRTVEDPWEVQVAVWANGKKDIPATQFNERDILIALGVPICGHLEYRSAEAEETHFRLFDDVGTITIKPSVIRNEMLAEWVFLTEGKPLLDLSQAPLDTKLFSWQEEYKKPRQSKTAAKIGGWTLVGLGVVLFVGSLFVGPLWGISTQTLVTIVPFASTGMLMSGVLLLTFGTIGLGPRLAAAKKALERRAVSAKETK